MTAQGLNNLVSAASLYFNVKSYGAVGDGIHNDSPAFAAALAACGIAGGGVVYVPPSGKLYVIAAGLANHYSGCSIEGVGGYNQPGNVFDNNPFDWAATGSWLWCQDTVNPCVSLTGVGQKLSGINYWYTQPTPTTNACGPSCVMTHNWTPTPYPFTVTVLPAQNGNSVTNNYVVNGYNCIDIEGNQNESAGVNSYGFVEDHNRWGCFNVVQQFKYIDNTISLHDWRDQTWWYIGSTDLLGYMEGDATHPGHRVGMDMYYVANAQLSDVEFYEDWAGIRATDASVTSGLGQITFGAQALQGANISFNQTCQGIVLASGTTHFSGRFSNVIAAGDVQTAGVSGQCSQAWPWFFNLNSDNADFAISNLDGYEMQGIAQIGNGNSGVLHLLGNVRGGFSDFASGANAFLINSNAALDMPADLNSIFAGPGAGAVINGTVNWPTYSASPTTFISGYAGSARQTTYLTGLFARWGTVADVTAESGGNAGSNFGIYRYADNGSLLDIPFGINRATGKISILDGLLATPLPTSCAGQATGTFYNTTTSATGGGSTLGVCP